MGARLSVGGTTDVEIDLDAPFQTTIARQLLASAALRGERPAIADGEVRLTYAELADEVRRAAGAFVASGLQPGERVAVWAPNSHRWVVGALAASMAGAVLVPLNTRYKGGEAVDILVRSKASFLLTVNGFLGNDYPAMLAEAGFDPAARLTTVVLSGEPSAGALSWDELCDRATPASTEEALRRAMLQPAEDLSDIIFTSGTTGRPKGVMCSHAQTLRVFATWASTVGLRADDHYLVVAPFFHTFGYKSGIVSSLITGNLLVPAAVFDVATVLRTIEAERITVLPGAPTIYLSILNHPGRDELDLSSLRLAVTGAADVPIEMIRRMREELTFRTILTAYGLTESTGTVTMCRDTDDAVTISTTSGRAIPDVEVRVVDDDNRPLPSGEPGEVVCRGYNVMQGYLDDPAATAEAIDTQGWLHTGDIGVLDGRGYLRITDRKKDMFIIGGNNAYPAEIEGILLRHPAVAEAAVVGAPDPRMGEVGHAFVVARHGATVEPAELIAWARANMANYKVPRHVHLVDALPYNLGGKVLKYELRERAARWLNEHTNEHTKETR